MTDEISAIRAQVIDEFHQYEDMYNTAFSTTNPLLKQVYDVVKMRKGKQIRPIILLLTAKAVGRVTQETLYSALVLELLHNTTLIHDDVVDEAKLRRGDKSVNAQFGNKVAVLAGDYLLSHIFSLTHHIKDEIIFNAIGSLGKSLSDGEILQLMNTNSPKASVENYINIIRKKTAVLFLTCTIAGVRSTGNRNDDLLNCFSDYGDYLGLCFQIKDDIFDYLDDREVIGKPVGNDIREKKVTLPLILALDRASGVEREEASALLASVEELTPEQTQWFIALVAKYGGTEQAQAYASMLKDKGLEALSRAEGIIGSSRYTDALKEMIGFVVDRER